MTPFSELLEDHLSTWGPHCGAPLEVYKGHLRTLLTAHADFLKRPVAPFLLSLTHPIVFIDVESIGVDPETARIIEFAACVLHPDHARKYFCQRFNPEMPIPKESTEIHGISDADVKDCPPFRDHAVKIHRAMQQRDIGGYNLRRLDLPVIDAEFRRSGLKLDVTGINIIDAFGIYQKKDPRKLENAVAKYCGRSHENAHGAAADAEASLDVWLGQMGMHEDLRGMGLDEQAQFCLQGDNQPADLAGKLYLKDGEMYYAFGKAKDKCVADDPGFGMWMLRQNSPPFPGSTCEVLTAEFKRLGLM